MSVPDCVVVGLGTIVVRVGVRHHADVHLVLRHDVELTVAIVLILREG